MGQHPVGQPPVGQPPAGQPPVGQPPAGQAPGRAVPPPPRSAWHRPARVYPVPDTPYGLAIVAQPQPTSGAAIGAMVAGMAALLLSFVVTCFGMVGASDGWGAAVAGAFLVLTGFLALVALGVGMVGIRQTRRPRPGAPAAAVPQGRGMAAAGLACGAAGLVIAVTALVAAVLIQQG